ncbi:pantoate--beta-alanine ligase [Novosphingobium sp.]|uniref:pantoate--beta-alanine ligase n=1 Tax=Novosphingobium sp. TaxID=1874826 RepID=UPI0025E639CE|nr:pantoate--beta-alanine ligase [Novosphingobium sp.]
MQTIFRLDALRTCVADLKMRGKDQIGRSLALVPTMGAIHDGHLALVREARNHADLVAVSIFVNPRQFSANEDLDAYPRTFDADSALLAAEGVDLLWAPTLDQMYPAGYATNVSVSGVSEGACGASRPGHFDGVATVVCKLFHQVLPDIALFGEKDWQQLAVIRQMARDLDLTRPHVHAIIGVPIVREADGLALSSRNRYLSPEDRARAVALPQAMHRCVAVIEQGEAVPNALAALHVALLSAGFSTVDYAELRDSETLAPLVAIGPRPARLLVAARIGGTRLIDNMGLSANL